MQISLLKDTNSDNPKEIRVLVKVSAVDDAEAELVESHYFNLQNIQEDRSIAIDVFNLKPKAVDLRKYGKKLFSALFSEKESSSTRRLLQDILQPQSTGRILLELNGDHDLDVIPWEYAWGNHAYLVHQCIFARMYNTVPNRSNPEPSLTRFRALFSSQNRNETNQTKMGNQKELQQPKFPLRIVAVVPDPVIPPDHPHANLPDLHLSGQFQNFIDSHFANNKKVILERVFPPTVDQMDAVLMNNPETATALHFMGHCQSKDGARTLVFEHEEFGKHEFADTSHLLSVPKHLRLAFLSACDTRDVARVLLQHGVPYTIGSYCDLPDDLARKFESKFYQFLAGDCTVEKAMWRARVFLQSYDNVRQRDYFPGAMVLYSSTFREDDGAFECESGDPIVNLHMPRNNLRCISSTSRFFGRTKELTKLNSVLRRMANRNKQICRMFTIKGISGQGKTALALEAARRMAHLFPGGIFAWRFDDMTISVIDYFPRLIEVIFSDKDQLRLKVLCNDNNDVQRLGSAIAKEFENHPTCLLLLDHADTLNTEAVDRNAAALREWLRETVSTSNSTVKILATSREALGWTGEETMHLDGLTDGGVELFIGNIDVNVRQRMEKETNTNTNQQLQDLARLVDGHPLCLESLGHAIGLPQHRNVSFEELVRENLSTMLVNGSIGSRNLETRFRPTIDALPTQKRLLLCMCSLFTGPITEGVLAFVRYFANYTDASSERIDSDIEAIVKNLQQLCDSGLFSKEDKEYKIHIAVREAVRQCNSLMKLRLRFPVVGVYKDTFVIGVTKPSKHGFSTVLEWQLQNIRSEVKNRTYGIQYYDIVDIPGTSDHKLEKDGVQQQVLFFGGLVVFRRNASEILQASFPQFCLEQIVPIVVEKKSAFILCLKYTNSELAEPCTTNVEKNVSLMKKATEILRDSLEKTHYIIRTEPCPGIIHASEWPANTLPSEANNFLVCNIDFGNVHSYGQFIGRHHELQRLEELFNDKRIRYITIRGFGGIGKTALAIQAVKRFHSGRVLVISLARNPSLDSVISMIVGFLNIDTETFRDSKTRQNTVIDKLTSGVTMLFYLDNMEDVKHATEQADPATKNNAISLIRFFNQMPENIKVLATSRIALDWPNEQFVELNGLEPHDGMQVFRQWASQRSDDIDDDIALRISRLAGGHPLSIRLLGRVFNNCMESVDQIINNFSKRLQDATDLLEERYDSVDTCIQYSFEYLDDILRSLLGQLRIFEVPFSATLVRKASNHSTTSSLASSVENNLHKLCQQSWLNELKYDPMLGDWLPRFMEKDTRFYALHPRLRDFLDHQFGDVKDSVADVSNDMNIQFYTALCYGVGFGVANDLGKQIEWCEKAAMNGHLESQLTLAVCYQEGAAGVDIDKKKALEWYLKAAEAGDRDAQAKVADCYWKGDVVEKNESLFDYWSDRYHQNQKNSLSIKFDLSRPMLHRAAEVGHLTLARSLLNQPDPNVDLKDRHGNTSVHRAAENGQAGFVAMLVAEFGADADAKNNDGCTPLHFAAERGHAEVVKLLVAEFRADANAKNNSEWMPLCFAADNGHLEVVKLLTVELGADANAKSNCGWFPLFFAAHNGHVEIVKLLVAEFGADVNAKGDDDGYTPLLLAARNGCVDVVRMLVAEFGADANAKSYDGCTPLLLAAKNRHIEVVKLLAAEFGADANAKNEGRETPLHGAAMNGDVEIVKLLIAEFGTDANAKNTEGETPLHKAAVKGHVEVMRILVAEHRADVNIKDNAGWTPLHWVAANGKVEVVKLLVAELGADTNAKASDGSTALLLATKRGHVEVVKLLQVNFLKQNTTLTTLNLEVESPKQDMTLTTPNLEYNSIGDEGARPLAESLEQTCCKMVSVAHNFNILHSDNVHWRLDRDNSSRFDRVAHLVKVWWLDLEGTFEKVASGNYIVVLRMKMQKECIAMANTIFRFETKDTEELLYEYKSPQVPSNLRSDNWVEYTLPQNLILPSTSENTGNDIRLRIQNHGCQCSLRGWTLDWIALFHAGNLPEDGPFASGRFQAKRKEPASPQEKNNHHSSLMIS